jgi:nucleoside-diphosphate-sugar epimerase
MIKRLIALSLAASLVFGPETAAAFSWAPCANPQSNPAVFTDQALVAAATQQVQALVKLAKIRVSQWGQAQRLAAVPAVRHHPIRTHDAYGRGMPEPAALTSVEIAVRAAAYMRLKHSRYMPTVILRHFETTPWEAYRGLTRLADYLPESNVIRQDVSALHNPVAAALSWYHELIEAALEEREGRPKDAATALVQEIAATKAEIGFFFAEYARAEQDDYLAFLTSHPAIDHEGFVDLVSAIRANPGERAAIVADFVRSENLIVRLPGKQPVSAYIVADPIFSLIKFKLGVRADPLRKKNVFAVLPIPADPSEQNLNQRLTVVALEEAERLGLVGARRIRSLFMRGGVILVGASSVKEFIPKSFSQVLDQSRQKIAPVYGYGRDVLPANEAWRWATEYAGDMPKTIGKIRDYYEFLEPFVEGERPHLFSELLNTHIAALHAASSPDLNQIQKLELLKEYAAIPPDQRPQAVVDQIHETLLAAGIPAEDFFGSAEVKTTRGDLRLNELASVAVGLSAAGMLLQQPDLLRGAGELALMVLPLYALNAILLGGLAGILAAIGPGKDSEPQRPARLSMDDLHDRRNRKLPVLYDGVAYRIAQIQPAQRSFEIAKTDLIRGYDVLLYPETLPESTWSRIRPLTIFVRTGEETPFRSVELPEPAIVPPPVEKPTSGSVSRSSAASKPRPSRKAWRLRTPVLDAEDSSALGDAAALIYRGDLERLTELLLEPGSASGVFDAARTMLIDPASSLPAANSKLSENALIGLRLKAIDFSSRLKRPLVEKLDPKARQDWLELVRLISTLIEFDNPSIYAAVVSTLSRLIENDLLRSDIMPEELSQTIRGQLLNIISLPRHTATRLRLLKMLGAWLTDPAVNRRVRYLAEYDPEADIRKAANLMLGRPEDPNPLLSKEEQRERRRIVKRIVDSAVRELSVRSIPIWLIGELVPDWNGGKQPRKPVRAELYLGMPDYDSNAVTLAHQIRKGIADEGLASHIYFSNTESQAALRSVRRSTIARERGILLYNPGSSTSGNGPGLNKLRSSAWVSALIMLTMPWLLDSIGNPGFSPVAGIFAGLSALLALAVPLAALSRMRDNRYFIFRSPEFDERARDLAEYFMQQLNESVENDPDPYVRERLRLLQKKLKHRPLVDSPLRNWLPRVQLAEGPYEAELGLHPAVRRLFAEEFFARMESQRQPELEQLTRSILADPRFAGMPEEEWRERGLHVRLVQFIDKKILPDPVGETRERTFHVFAQFSGTPDFHEAVKDYFAKVLPRDPYAIAAPEEPAAPSMPQIVSDDLLEILENALDAPPVGESIAGAIREAIAGRVYDAVTKVRSHREIAEAMLQYFQMLQATGSIMQFFGVSVPGVPYDDYIVRLRDALIRDEQPRFDDGFATVALLLATTGVSGLLAHWALPGIPALLAHDAARMFLALASAGTVAVVTVGKVWTPRELLDYFGKRRVPQVVTGANGFIGSHLVRALLSRKEPVLAVVRSAEEPRLERLKAMRKNPDLFIVNTGDLRAILKRQNGPIRRAVRQLVQRSPRVFHLAAQAHAPAIGFEKAVESFLMNGLIPLILVNWLSQSGGRLIYPSSALVYWEMIDLARVPHFPKSVDESTPLPAHIEGPLDLIREDFANYLENVFPTFLQGKSRISPDVFVRQYMPTLPWWQPDLNELPKRIAYAVSKLVPEAAILGMQPGHGGVVRMVNIIGPHAREDYVVPNWMRQMAAGASVIVQPGKRQFLFVTDAVRAIIGLADYLSAGGSENPLLLLASDERPKSNEDLFYLVRAAMRYDVYPFTTILPGEAPIVPQLVPRAAKRLIQWTARYRLRDSLSKIAEPFLRHKIGLLLFLGTASWLLLHRAGPGAPFMAAALPFLARPRFDPAIPSSDRRISQSA